MQNERDKQLYSYSFIRGKIGKNELWKLEQKANEIGVTIALDLTIVHIGYSKMNSFADRGNDMIYARVGQSYLVFGLMFSNMQFYANKHNF
jgi:hypothetical protein